MEKIIRGKVYVLGDNVDTDQIIPAEHLVYSTSEPQELKKYGHFALSGVPLNQAGLPEGGQTFIDGDNYLSRYSIIVAGSNFGCGSSREHAPLALQVAGIKAVVSQSYARIFYRNAVDGGFLVPLESVEKINDRIKTGEEIELDIDKDLLKNLSTGQQYHINPLGDVFEIVNAGGLFEYARNRKMLVQ